MTFPRPRAFASLGTRESEMELPMGHPRASRARGWSGPWIGLVACLGALAATACSGPPRPPPPSTPAVPAPYRDLEGPAREYHVPAGGRYLVKLRCAASTPTRSLVESHVLPIDEAGLKVYQGGVRGPDLEISVAKTGLDVRTYTVWTWVSQRRPPISVEDLGYEGTGSLDVDELVERLNRSRHRGTKEVVPDDVEQDQDAEYQLWADLEVWVRPGFQPRRRIQSLLIEGVSPIDEDFKLSLHFTQGEVWIKVPYGIRCRWWRA